MFARNPHRLGVLFPVIILATCGVASAQDLSNVNERFRFFNRNPPQGFTAYMPNGEQAQYGSKLFYGGTLYSGAVTQTQDVTTSDLKAALGSGDLSNHWDLFRAVNRWARSKGYGGAFPNFEQSGDKHGVVTIHPELVEVRDFGTADLGSFGDDWEKFRKFHRHAGKLGFQTAFPNGEQGPGVLGAICIKKSPLIRSSDILGHDDCPDFSKPSRCTAAMGNMTCSVWVSRTGEVKSDFSAGLKKQSGTYHHECIIILVDADGNILRDCYHTQSLTIGAVVTPLGQPRYVEKTSSDIWKVSEANARKVCKVYVDMRQFEGGNGSLIDQFKQISDDYDKVRNSSIVQDAVKVIGVLAAE